MKVIATWISVQLLFTARCPVAWLEWSLIWGQGSEKDRETEGEKERGRKRKRGGQASNKKASLWRSEHWRPFTQHHILVSGGKKEKKTPKHTFWMTSSIRLNTTWQWNQTRKWWKKGIYVWAPGSCWAHYESIIKENIRPPWMTAKSSDLSGAWPSWHSASSNWMITCSPVWSSPLKTWTDRVNGKLNIRLSCTHTHRRTNQHCWKVAG